MSGKTRRSIREASVASSRASSSRSRVSTPVKKNSKASLNPPVNETESLHPINTSRFFYTPLYQWNEVRRELGLSRGITTADIDALNSGKTIDELRDEAACEKAARMSEEPEVKKARRRASNLAKVKMIGADQKNGRKPVKEIDPTQIVCRHCKGGVLRVVDVDRDDGYNVLECANRYCLASVRLTTQEAGKMYKCTHPKFIDYGWYLNDPHTIYYPPIDNCMYEQADSSRDYSEPPTPLRDGEGRLMLRCPGQRTLCRFI